MKIIDVVCAPGRTGFYFSIPALIYLFCIMAFSGNRPVALRSVSVLFFVFFAKNTVQTLTFMLK